MDGRVAQLGDALVSRHGNPLRVAVLVKQIPLVEEMRLGEDGRLMRAGVASEINPYCRRAITKGVELAAETGGSCVAFSLGPPAAAEALREALAAGVDEAVLLTDPSFAGSDTLATARALAAALGQERPDLVLLGLNSVDAETGQVGPQLAEVLGLPFVPGARQLSVAKGQIVAESEYDAGTANVTAPLPAVVSVAERLCAPAKRGPAECAAVDPRRIRRIDAASLGPGPWGQDGSPTRVAGTRPVLRERRGEQLEGDIEEQVARLVDLLAERGALVSPQGDSVAVDVGSVPPPRSGGHTVVAVLDPGRPRLARELLGGAARLAAAVGGNVVAVHTDADPGPLGDWGADEILLLRGLGRSTPDPEDVAHVVAQWAESQSPWAVLACSTTWGRHVCGRVAARLSAGLTGDAVELEVHSGRMVSWKPAFGGVVEAAITCQSPVQLATVRPGAFSLLQPRRHDAAGSVLQAPVRGQVRVTERRWDERVDAIASSAVIVGVGKGVDPHRYRELKPLLDRLGAELVATRKVTDEGHLPRSRQVGLTGQHIAPTLYLALGVSGKSNHMIGIRKAGTVVAVNSDREAPVFREADFGITADWEETVRALTKRLTEASTLPSSAAKAR